MTTLSKPVHQLKRSARILSRAENIPLHAALDRVAAGEGYGGWSLLSKKAEGAHPAEKIYPRLVAGDMLLVGARPGQGKTRFSLELAVEAMKAGHPAFFFTLEYTGKEVAALFAKAGADATKFAALFTLDSSDGIHAGHITERLKDATRGTLAVVDYLQLLDQKRETAQLEEQMRWLKEFATARGIVFVFISQIDRSYDPAVKPLPDMTDVRLPNPLDTAIFTKSCFMQGGDVRFRSVA